MLYPGESGPWSGQRFEAHRIGLEDYELLALLRLKRPELATKLIDEMVRGFNDYEKDVVAYRSIKRRALEALDE